MRLACSFFLALIFGIVFVQAQPTPKELAKHRKDVARSARNKDAIISLDTLFYTGQPYALVRKKHRYDYSYQLVSLQGEPLFWVDLETGIAPPPGGPPTTTWRVYTFVFAEEPETAALPVYTNWSDNDLAREIIRYQLLDQKGLNRTQAMAFADSHRRLMPEKEPVVVTETAPGALLPARDRTAPVYRRTRNTIYQDNVYIGMIWTKQDRATKEVSARLFDTEGRRLTSFMFLPDATNSIEFSTTTDGKVHIIQVGPEQDAVLEVSAYLVAKNYL